MLFNSLEFIIFLAFLIIILNMAKKNLLRKTIIIAASYYFYAYIDYKYLILLIIPTLSDFYLGKFIGSGKKKAIRKILLSISIIVNLTILGFFKYYNFFVTSFTDLFSFIGFQVGTLEIILPVGISFYLFKSMTYTIDVYREKIKICDNIIDYAIFISYFPNLLAGPIVKASKFLPLLKDRPRISCRRMEEAFWLFSIGLFKKVFIADRLGGFVDFVFQNNAVFDTWTIWLAAMAYTVQIYCDFAGYSDMAIGVSKALGYDLEDNFNWPYISNNIQDFWRRWHISLSQWIKEYVYFSFGGNRKGKFRTYINLLGAMLLCGLWHGAGWNFILWGGFHGIALVAHRFWKNNIAKSNGKEYDNRYLYFLNIMLTMSIVIVGWVLFRAENLSIAFDILVKMALPSDGVAWYHPFAIYGICVIAMWHIAKILKMKVVEIGPHNKYAPAIALSFIWLAITFYPKGFAPFIYFQF